ncbi:MAG TPA: GGDEF domain-containing protein [Dokdonella sp.]|jgi:diguanylate cyclase (GGDEF)-like protein|nr:GGDEF domain-containing protein [Dokdonella sp.]
MELMLWRWSTMVQATSVVLITGFLIALAHSMRRDELRIWVCAWVANLLALLVTILFWILQPEGRLAFVVAAWSYFFAKTLFVVLLVDGAAGFVSGQPVRRSYTRLLAIVAALSLAAAMAVRTVDMLGLVQSVVICLMLGSSAIFLARKRSGRLGWLSAGFAIRAVLAFAEGAAYAAHALLDEAARPAFLATFLSVHSSFDAGAEWVIALGCVLTLHGAIQRELTQANSELSLTQVQLRDLLQRDQLTGVLNRRALPALLRDSQAAGASIVFFDLDDFKSINDAYGHQAGDKCLRLFARTLQEIFPAGDRVIRYAGDEFIVITRDTDPEAIEGHVRSVRLQLELAIHEAPAIGFSHGTARVPDHGDPELALHEADQAMYRAKPDRAA